MKIYTYCELIWDGEKYTLDESKSKWYDYIGPIDKCCGATSGQEQIGQQQNALFGTLQQQLSTVFGSSSSVFNDLVNSYSPIVAAGPNQQGFSAAEDASLKSQAITNVGQGYQNVRQTVGEQEAAQGGGNLPGVASGSNIGINLGVAEGAANQTANELNQITQANYAQGRQNWIQAAQGLAGAPQVFNPATGAGGVAVGAGNAASNTQNEIAQESNSWVNALIGAGAGIAGAAAGGFAGRPSGGGSTPNSGSGDAGSWDINGNSESWSAPGYSTQGFPS